MVWYFTLKLLLQILSGLPVNTLLMSLVPVYNITIGKNLEI